MNGRNMPVTLRLSDAEQEALRQKAIEINRLLVKQGRQPVRDSELAHKILALSVTCVGLSLDGDIVLEHN
jgi:hypothetical protein